MSQATLKLTTRVLPGSRIEVVAPELPEGAEVEIFVALPEGSLPSPNAPRYVSALDFLDSLPPSTLTSADWQRIESELQEEKNSWER